MPDLTTRLIILVTAMLLSACASTSDNPKTDYQFVVGGLQIQLYGDIENLEAPTLYIFLHGDSCVADYMKNMAKNTVERNVLSIVMARPGCSVNGNISVGVHLKDDPYTADKIDAVASSVRLLKEHYKARKVFLIGHSGGAATAGIILGQYPALVDGMVVIAFPANIPELIAHHKMKKSKYMSLSPHNFIEGIKSTSSIHIIVGSDDERTPPLISESYVNDARERGLEVEYLVLEGLGHNRATLYAHETWRTITNLADE